MKQLLQANLIGTDTVQRAQLAHQHEIQTFECTRALQCQLVGWRFHHAQPRWVPLGVAANIANFMLREGVALAAMQHLRCGIRQRLRHDLGACPVVLQQVKRHA